MKAKDYLSFIVNEIHSTVAATVDEEGLPVTCAIDMMDCDGESLYFLTAKGKSFYRRLIGRNTKSLSVNKAYRLGETIFSSRKETERRRLSATSSGSRRREWEKSAAIRCGLFADRLLVAHRHEGRGYAVACGGIRARQGL